MKHLIGAAIVAVSFGSAAFASTITDTFTSYYAFGDSLTDNGKLGALDPPSLEGRFSNGPVYAEYIADLFVDAGLDTGNIALGGARAGGSVNLAAPLSTFSGQIATFASSLFGGFGLPTKLLPTVELASAAPIPGSRSLVSVLFGANDIFGGLDPAGAADAVASGIRSIGALGSQFNDFLVLSLPDIGKTPAFAGPDAAAATAATNVFNFQLSENIDSLRGEGFNIFAFDTNEVLDDIFADAALGGPEYGVVDVSTPCTVSVGYALDPTLTNPFNCVDAGVDPNKLLFIDGVHPNGVAHELIGERVIAQLDATLAPVPLPATLPFLLAGMIGMGAVARRRRSA
jgi:phospholipase/lecithinase/hemolysin